MSQARLMLTNMLAKKKHLHSVIDPACCWAAGFWTLVARAGGLCMSIRFSADSRRMPCNPYSLPLCLFWFSHDLLAVANPLSNFEHDIFWLSTNCDPSIQKVAYNAKTLTLAWFSFLCFPISSANDSVPMLRLPDGGCSPSCHDLSANSKSLCLLNPKANTWDENGWNALLVCMLNSQGLLEQ